MLMSSFLKNRKSIRDFKEKDADKKVLEELMDYGKKLESAIGKNSFKFILFEDGKLVHKALSGKGGYAGVMIKSPHYIVLELLDESEDCIINASYAMENLITKASELNLGSCWISVVDVEEDMKKALFELKNGKVDYILAIGYPVAKNPFVQEGESCRLAVEEIVYKDEIGNKIDMDELENRGLSDLFYYIRFAPSSYNNQPWRFILKDDRVVLTLMCNDNKYNLVDAGIIMYYFENMAKSIGVNGSWKLLHDEDCEVDKVLYKFIGEFYI
ncbi:nitroreductase family protein [Sporanaerobacter acetigenes]|uniref:Nitroreductase n=1 Tax=Sporanaerobacter acetigenes DSM 13106 TaxID=1123281 RepID=A0A1M5X6P5_9FIRM|nr:nitroreductase family protein [Sporanaerobacter acetigenes]SHH95248.1 Nitroreductase [Sporanaerobacter acetigenes DSM 13106]